VAFKIFKPICVVLGTPAAFNKIGHIGKIFTEVTEKINYFMAN
jgi:hypothetical protein